MTVAFVMVVVVVVTALGWAEVITLTGIKVMVTSSVSAIFLVSAALDWAEAAVSSGIVTLVMSVILVMVVAAAMDWAEVFTGKGTKVMVMSLTIVVMLVAALAGIEATVELYGMIPLLCARMCICSAAAVLQTALQDSHGCESAAVCNLRCRRKLAT